MRCGLLCRVPSYPPRKTYGSALPGEKKRSSKLKAWVVSLKHGVYVRARAVIMQSITQAYARNKPH